MTEKWDEDLYNEVLQSMINYLDKRRRWDRNFTSEVLRELIDTEYAKQDNAWAGKSPIEGIKDSATIAAFELYLSEWEERGN